MYKSKFNLNYPDGSATHTTTASMALLHWTFQDIPSNLPENPEPFVLYPNPVPVPGPYDNLFLVNVLAATERKFGIGPNLPRELLSKAWYSQLPEEIDHNFVLAALADGNRLVKFYEDVCLNILHWLELKSAFKLEICDV